MLLPLEPSELIASLFFCALAYSSSGEDYSNLSSEVKTSVIEFTIAPTLNYDFRFYYFLSGEFSLVVAAGAGVGVAVSYSASFNFNAAASSSAFYFAAFLALFSYLRFAFSSASII